MQRVFLAKNLVAVALLERFAEWSRCPSRRRRLSFDFPIAAFQISTYSLPLSIRQRNENGRHQTSAGTRRRDDLSCVACRPPARTSGRWSGRPLAMRRLENDQLPTRAELRVGRLYLTDFRRSDYRDSGFLPPICEAARRFGPPLKSRSHYLVVNSISHETSTGRATRCRRRRFEGTRRRAVSIRPTFVRLGSSEVPRDAIIQHLRATLRRPRRR
jgi:hypothetical protein